MLALWIVGTIIALYVLVVLILNWEHPLVDWPRQAEEPEADGMYSETHAPRINT